ncbi:MAG: hypothetical protein KBF26_02960 [Opitutaceae bacterium]|nr:hypothetical protein [Opitutaceae bacterium]
MKKTREAVLVLFALALALFITSCRGESNLPPPTQITERLKSEAGYEALTTWVDNYLKEKKTSPDEMEIEVGTEQHPVCFLSKDKFDWKIIGLDTLPAGEIRITCDVNGKWKAVHLGFFRYGVIVNIQNRPLALNGSEIVFQDKRIAVFSDSGK